MSEARSPRSAEPARPQVGLDTFVVLDHAVVALADRRFVVTLDAASQLHLLASLVAQAEVWLGEQVAAARAAGMSWAVIGRLLGLSAAAARQRYGARPKADAQPRVRPAPREVPPLVS